MNVYFISGMGADERMFRNIRLAPQHKMIHVPWIKALPKETLPDYASRLAGTMDRSQPFAVVGLSMGGMIATEIARQVQGTKALIISSITRPSMLPLHLRMAGWLRLDQLIPFSVVTKLSALKRTFGPETDEQKKMLLEMIRTCDREFLRWSMRAVLTWKPGSQDPSIYHAHGTRDYILPIKSVHPDLVVKGGGHLMILSHGPALSRWINEILEQP